MGKRITDENELKERINKWFKDPNTKINTGLSIDEIEEPEFKFECRICGSTKFEGVYGSSMFTPLGGRMYPMSYQCSGCSVVFKNPKLFSKPKTQP